jgi:hypothetical protein
VGHDPAPQVPAAGDRPALQHLGDVFQPPDERIPAGVLGDLDGDERGHAVADRHGGDVRAPAGDHAGALQPVQPGLHGPAGDPQPPARLQHTDPRLGGEQGDDVAVQTIQCDGCLSGHGVPSPVKRITSDDQVVQSVMT